MSQVQKYEFLQPSLGVCRHIGSLWRVFGWLIWLIVSNLERQQQQQAERTQQNV
jgi:hypothetical protein